MGNECVTEWEWEYGGVGFQSSLQLARRGLNVVIMSRSQEKLQKVADEISETRYCLKHTHPPSLSHTHPLTPSLSHTLTEAQYDVEVMVIAVDFSSGQKVYPQIAQQLKNLDIGVLSMRVSEIGQGRHTH